MMRAWILLFCSALLADGAPVYLHYQATNNIDVYQEMSGAGGFAGRWLRWRLHQYTGGNGCWIPDTLTAGRLSTTNEVPGDGGWSYTSLFSFQDGAPGQYEAIYGNLSGETGSWGWCAAHANHEYNSATNITIDGTPYYLGDNFTLGQIIPGTTAVMAETSTVYGQTQTVSDFGTLYRIMTWATNAHLQYWRLDLSNSFTVSESYPIMWPIDLSVVAFWRVTLGNTNKYLCNNLYPGRYGSFYATSDLTNAALYGGPSQCRVSVNTAAPAAQSFIKIAADAQKIYWTCPAWHRLWNAGESMGGYTSTIKFDYEPIVTIGNLNASTVRTAP